MLRRAFVPLHRLTRCYATSTYISPAAAADIGPANPHSTKPASPSFFTGRAKYYDALISLEATLNSCTRELRMANIYPPPAGVAKTLTYYKPDWRGPADLYDVLQTKIRMTPYRRLLKVLDELVRVRAFARMADMDELDARITEVLKVYDLREGEEEVLEERHPYSKLDEYGRSYGLGARKESSCRVWMIPTRADLPSARPPDLEKLQAMEDAEKAAAEAAEKAARESESQKVVDNLGELFSSPQSIYGEPKPSIEPEPDLPPIPPTAFLTSTILINQKPLAEYFSLPYDREAVIRPLRITGLLGAFNVFAIARGGGTTGQAHATAHGIAKCIMSHAPQMKGVLTRAGLLHRDPRMVERKKTGQPKARKKYTWVKR